MDAYYEDLAYSQAVKDIIAMIDNAPDRVEAFAKKLAPTKNVI